ncbi:hypothetical protein ACIOEZ_32670 [Streptomyces sp. NPDC087866]|uniref:hypothetical protein n=1 Tax=Streptomyces sp. NPDC087866 TaxID=3365815 RepID=UPI003809F763
MPTTEQTVELQPAPHGYGISSTEGGVLLHTLVTKWEARYWKGNPKSLWTEHRASRWIVWAAARCQRGLDWKVDDPGPGDGWRLCPTCQLDDGERLARLCRDDRPPFDLTHLDVQEPEK